VRVDVVGVPTVQGPAGVRAGSELGGRRAHVVLVALALAGGPVTSAALAELVWRGRPPETWPVALRGVVRGLRVVVAALGVGTARRRSPVRGSSSPARQSSPRAGPGSPPGRP